MNKCYVIIAKKLAGEISASDPEWSEWRTQTCADERLHARAGAIWQSIEAPVAGSDPDLHKGWQRLSAELSPARQPGLYRDRSVIRRLRRAPAFSLAAALGILVIVLIGRWSNQSTLQWRHTATANAEKRIVYLADGSRVTLNSASRLDYPDAFKSAERLCRLQGEAFFEIAEDAEHPFRVQTANARITVLGTCYNVRARQENTRVLVRDGRVRLQSLFSDSSVILLPGHAASVTGQAPPSAVETSDLYLELAWLHNRLAFEKTPLNVIAAELERFYNITIRIENQQHATTTLTGEFDTNSAEAAIASICLTLQIHYRKELDTYFLY